MTFGKSISTCFSKYAVFTGRASRSEYWWFALFNLLVTLVIYAIIIGIISAIILKSPHYDDNRLLNIGSIICGIYGLAVFLPSLGVAIRRLHDAGHSGWYYLLSFIPVIGTIILLVFLVQPSVPVPNKYGEVPQT